MSINEADLDAAIAADRARSGLPPEQNKAVPSTDAPAPAAAAAPAAPAGPATTTGQPGLKNYLTDAGSTLLHEAIPAVWNGVSKATNEAANLVNKGLNAAGVNPGYLQFGGNDGGEFVKWYHAERDKAALIPDSMMLQEPKGKLGQFLENAVQVTTGLVALNKLGAAAEALPVVGGAIKAAGAVIEGSKVGKAIAAAAKTALAEPLVMDAYQERLSNMVEDMPWIGDPIKRYLAANHNDNLATAKLKQGLEGFIVGVPMEAIFGMVSYVRQSRLLKNKTISQQAAAEGISKTMTELDASLNSAEHSAYLPEVQTDGSVRIKVKATGELLPEIYKTEAHAASEASSLNTIADEKLRMNTPAKPFTEEQVQAFRDTAGSLEGTEKFKKILEEGGTDFNFHVIHGLEDAKLQLETMSTIEREAIDAARGGAKVTNDTSIKMAQQLFPGEDATKIVGDLARVYTNSKDLDAHLLAGKKLMFLVADRVKRLSTLADADPDNAINMGRMADALEGFFSTVAQVKGIITSAARATQIGNVDVGKLLSGLPEGAAEGAANAAAKGAKEGITSSVVSAAKAEAASAGPQSFAARKVLAALHGMSADDMRILARRVALANGDPEAILAAVNSTPKLMKAPTILGFAGKAGQKVAAANEYFINGWLAGSTTFAVNATMNLANSILYPIEYFNSGLNATWKGDLQLGKQLRQQGWDMLWGQFKGIRESTNMAWKAFKTGDAQLDPSTLLNSAGSRHYIEGDLGTMVRLPSRMLMSADEYFKQLAYRANVRASAMRDADQQGVVDVEKFIKDRMDASFMGGRGIDEKGLQYAKDVTFQTDLPSYSYGKAIQSFTADHPVTKLVMPFVNIAQNILYWNWQRTPLLRGLNQAVREDIAAGGARAAMRQSQLQTGVAMWGMGAGLVASGVVTGRGPSNPDLRKEWLVSHEPYSVWIPNAVPGIGGQWLSYKRADTFMGPTGLMSDFVGTIADLFHMSGEMHGHDYADIATAAVASLSNSFTSKTYLTGVVSFIEAVSSGSLTEMNNYLRNEVGALVPNSFNQTNPDPYMREVRGYVDAIQARLPGFSEKLPPKYNFLGEPILKPPGDITRPLNPFTLSGKTDGELERKILALGKAFPPPSNSENGVRFDTDQWGLSKEGLTPYDRMLQLVGAPKGGPTLRQELTTITNSPGWQHLPDSATKKYDMVAKVVAKHREIAMDIVKGEYKDLAKTIAQGGMAKTMQMYQGDEGRQRIQKYFSTQH